MTFEETRNNIKKLITDQTTTEEAEQIGAIITQFDMLEKSFNELAQSKSELNKKYVEAIKQNSFVMKEEKPQEKPLTLEECINAVLKERK